MSSPKAPDTQPKPEQPVELQDAEIEAATGAGPNLMEACAQGEPIKSHSGGVNAVLLDGSVRF